MRYAIIDSGTVANIIEADADFSDSIGAVLAQEAGIGWSYAGGVFTAPPVPPVPVPQQVTMRQACIQLEADGLLDDVEAVVATLPRIYQIEWQRASVVLRDNPLVEIVRQQQGMTAEQIDTLFINASNL